MLRSRGAPVQAPDREGCAWQLISNECHHKNSAVVEAAGRPFKQSIALLAKLLNLALIQGQDGAASLYGVSVLGHHIAVLAKAKGGSMVSVDMRSSDEALGKELCNEASPLRHVRVSLAHGCVRSACPLPA